MAADAFARVLSVLPEALLLVEADGTIRFANPQAAEMLAGVRSLDAGLSLKDFARGTSATLAEILRSCARSGQMLPGALTLIDASGNERDLRAEGVLLQPRTAVSKALVLLRLLPKEAALTRFAALNLRLEQLNREMARRRNVEQTLRDERELLHVTLASIGDAVIATNPAGRVTFMNRVAEEQTGWSALAAAGRPLHEVFVIVNETTRLPVESPVERVLRENMVVGLANHTVLIRRDGTAHPIDDAGAPIRDAEGNVLGVVLVFRDITERRALEHQRVEAERRKDEFLAMLAHELRNPIAAIAAGVEVLRRSRAGEDPDATGVAQVSDAMHRQVRQLARLVDDLLDVSRITTGKISLKRKPLSLNEVVEDALSTYRPTMTARNISLFWQPSPYPPLVYGDAERLGQVVGNLVANAVKFNREGGSVSVSTSVDDGRAIVRVSDTGEGIAPEVLPFIFDLFTQADTSLARSRGGLGIGLSVAKLLAERHNGEIEAHSAGPGQGARFTLRLPLHAQDEEHGTGGSETPSQRRTRRRILVVDDNIDAATTLAVLLRLSGHDVRAAHDGATALLMHSQSAAEIILLDLGMPGMDGYEVARCLREGREFSRVRIYALTGYGAPSDRARVSACGFDGHLTKPVDPQVLERLLEDTRAS